MSTEINYNSHKTAIKRKALSSPTKWLLKNCRLDKPNVLDFGCGYGYDADYLGLDKYDPYFFPELPNKRYDVVICNYVLNTLPKKEWENVLSEAIGLLNSNGILYISVRNDRHALKGITKRGTYQEFVNLNFRILYKNSKYIIYETHYKS